MNSQEIYSIEEIKEIISKHKEELENVFNAVNFFLFGSYAKGQQTPDSDIDLLVELKAPLGLKFFKLESFLGELFGKKVDLGTPNSLKPSVKNQILREAIKL